MKKMTAIALVLAAALACRADTTTTWRDAQGRVQGTMPSFFAPSDPVSVWRVFPLFTLVLPLFVSLLSYLI